MAPAVCVIEGCGRAVTARGMCGAHYQRLLKGRDLLVPVRAKGVKAVRCAAPKCRAKADTKGLCAFHYMRQRDGIPFGQRKQFHRPSVEHDAQGGCRVPGCGRKIAARGFCWGHYRRELEGKPFVVDYVVREGSKRVSVVKYGPKNAPQSVRRLAIFEWQLREALVTPEPTTGCLLWMGEFLPSGYGRVGNCRDPWGGYAHRAALHFAGVKLRKGNDLHVRHRCDNRACVNVAHLEYGRAWKNSRDRSLRFGYGSLTPEAVLDVRDALARGEMLTVIAKAHGVSNGAIEAIKAGKTWRWLTDVPAPHLKQDAA